MHRLMIELFLGAARLRTTRRAVSAGHALRLRNIVNYRLPCRATASCRKSMPTMVVHLSSYGTFQPQDGRPVPSGEFWAIANGPRTAHGCRGDRWWGFDWSTLLHGAAGQEDSTLSPGVDRVRRGRDYSSYERHRRHRRIRQSQHLTCSVSSIITAAVLVDPSSWFTRIGGPESLSQHARTTP
jgi:hypothetical protein